jgi:hypothetical protein
MAGANRRATRTGDAYFPYVDARTIKDAAKLYVGEMVAQDSTPEALAASDTAGLVILGVGTKEIDNTNDGETVDFISGAVHLMDNSSTALAKTDIGGLCYVEDAATVTTLAGATNNIPAGVVVDVTSDGVYVDFDPAKKA